jgi:hypothetical protein
VIGTDRCSSPEGAGRPGKAVEGDTLPQPPGLAGRDAPSAVALAPDTREGDASLVADTARSALPVKARPDIRQMASAGPGSTHEARCSSPSCGCGGRQPGRGRHSTPGMGAEEAGAASVARGRKTWSVFYHALASGPSRTMSWSGICPGAERSRRCPRRRHLAGGYRHQGRRLEDVAQLLEDHSGNPPWWRCWRWQKGFVRRDAQT